MRKMLDGYVQNGKRLEDRFKRALEVIEKTNADLKDDTYL